MNPEVKKLKERSAAYQKRHPKAGERPEKPPRRKRMRTHKRLKPGTKCAYCGKLLSTYTATIDHIVPLSRGGTHDPSNLCWCCKACNKSKLDKTVEEWKSCM